MISQRTIHYAIPPAGHFWKWSDDHEAIEWADGRTIALWQEVHALLAHLGREGGLPPLGAVILLLASCRSEWPQQRALNHAVVRSVAEIPVNDAIPPEIADVLITGLNQIHELPQDLRASLSAKCHLVSALFEGGPHCLLRRESELILQDLSIQGLRNAGTEIPAMTAKARFFRDIRALKTGLARHDAATLESLLLTGIEIPELLVSELPETPLDPREPHDLIDRLISLGGEGGAAAAVAKRTIAMMNFPGRFGAPRDLPVGGIADITNRGTIDRLLPGELAWDDLILAARLVHNEALYFRREIPPMNVAVSHTLLLDRGLRLWGTARVFSIGVALGLRHHPALQGPDQSFDVVAATVDAFETLDLTSPQGVRSALETLVPSPGPETFLDAWWDCARQQNDPSIPDLTFITAHEHLDEPGTRRLLGDIAAWIHTRNGGFRVLALARDGGMEMQAWSPVGNRTLCRGKLDLESILKPPPPSAPRQPPLRTQPDPLHALLPAYGCRRLPFLFPLSPYAWMFLEDQGGAGGGVGVSHDRRLMHWPKHGWGGEELSCNLPGRQHWIGRDDHDEIILIASGNGAGDIVRVFRWEQNSLAEIQIVASRHPFPRHAGISGGALILAYSESVEAISLENGHRLAEHKIPSLPQAPTLHFDGTTIRIEGGTRTNAMSQNTWKAGDSNLPQLFTPDGITWSNGIIRVTESGKCFSFDPVKLTWRKTRTGNLRFVPFEGTDDSPAPGIALKRAALGEHLEAWLDPRGLLHLRDLSHTDAAPWTILLASPAASIWHPSYQLHALEPRLLPPASTNPSRLPMVLLKDFLSAPANR
jgi:hypothetical protein